MSLPAYTVKVGWETAVSGTIRFDVSKFDGTDVFANAFTNFFTGTLDDVTDDVDGEAGATIARGRTGLLGPIQAGTFDCVLCHPTDPTLYDPNSPSSPLHALDPGFVPMRPVTVTSTVNSVSYPRFYGFIRTASYDPYTRRCTLHCEDLQMWLSRQKPTIATLTNTTTAAAIGAILNTVGWNDPNMRALSSFGGDQIATYNKANGTVTALDLITGLLTAERGVLYVDAAGRVVYEDRNARSRRTTAKAVFTDQQLAVEGDGASGIDLDNIVNEVTAIAASGIPQTKDNLPSQQDFGVGAETISSDLIPSDAAALQLAQMEAALASIPRSPYVATVDNDVLPVLYTLELQDRLRVSNSLSGTSDDYHLERVEETFGEGSLYVSLKLTLSKRGVAGFVFDSSKLDGADVFVY